MASSNGSMISGVASKIEEAAYNKVTWRLIPFLFLGYIFCFLDRVNVGFAKLQMQQQLGFSETVYGMAAGIFFISYFIFEIPSNLILQRIGPRIWIGRIMITWGLISSITMFVNSTTTFYLCRFLLGLMEAGFFPGIILYLTYWYPPARRAHINAMFLTAIPVSGLIGGPLSGWILETFSGAGGLAGWRWLFLIEGLPSIIMGIITLWYLDDGISGANWLTREEKTLLQHNIDQEKREKTRHSLKDAFVEWRVWICCIVYFCFCAGLYGFMFWMPSMIKMTGIKNSFTIGLLVAIPNGIAIVGMLLLGRSSDRNLERRWHTLICGLLAGFGLAFSAIFATNTWLSVLSLSVGMIGIMASLSIFWSVPTAILAGTAAAGGIALVNSIGNLSGFVAPYLLGYIKDITNNLNLGLYFLATLAILGGVLVLLFAPKRSNW